MFEIPRTAFTVFGIAVQWYGILIILGVLLAVLLACAREKGLGLKKDTTLDLALICLPAAIVCARIYYVAFSWKDFAGRPLDILNIRQGGLAIYGGIIGGILAGWIYCRIRKIPLARGLDLAAPSLALGQAIGRWGNFINREAYGAAVLNPRLQFFPMAVYIENSGWHYATFFYESIWCLLVAACLLVAERKRFFRRSGDIFGAYALLYGLERALVEGLRTDSLYLGPLRVSQMLSLAAVLAVCLLLARRRGRVPAGLRLLPACGVLLLAAALAMDAAVLSAAAAVLTAAITAAVYINM